MHAEIYFISVFEVGLLAFVAALRSVHGLFKGRPLALHCDGEFSNGCWNRKSNNACLFA